MDELVFIDGIFLNKNKYLSILKDNLIKSANNMNIQSSYKFYQDNDPKHKLRIVQKYLLYNCPKVLHLPSQLPDLNLIENLWNLLDRNIRITRLKEELKLKEEWTRITSDYLTKIISNMPKHLQHVIKQKRYPTKY